MQCVTGVGGGAVTATANPGSRSPRPLDHGSGMQKTFFLHRPRETALPRNWLYITAEGERQRPQEEFVAPSVSVGFPIDVTNGRGTDGSRYNVHRLSHYGALHQFS